MPFAHVAPLIRSNTLTLSETRVTPSVAMALGQFLEDTADIPEAWVHTLIIDDCQLTDESFAMILRGILYQGGIIQNLHYSKNALGPKSLDEMRGLLHNLRCLNIVDLKSIGGEGAPSRQVIRELLEACA